MDDLKTTPTASTTGTPTKPETTKAPQVITEDATQDVTVKIEPSKDKTPENGKETIRNIDAELGKIKALEQDRNEWSKKATEALREQDRLRQEKEEVEKATNATKEMLQNWFKGDPQAYELLRRKIISEGNPDPGTYESRYGSLPTQQGGYQSPIDPTTIDRLVDVKASEKIEQKFREREASDGLVQFMGKHPEYDLRNLDQRTSEYSTKFNELNKLGNLAAAVRNNNPSMSSSDAFEKAYMIEHIDEIKSDAQQVGEYAGRKSAYGAPVSSFSGSAVQTQIQEEIKLEGDAAKTYRSMLASGEKAAAERFARKMAGK